MHRTTRLLTTAVAGTLLATTFAVTTPQAGGATTTSAGSARAITSAGSARAITSAGSARAGSHHVTGRHRKHSGVDQQSLNWAGYIRSGHGFTSATGSWKVPTLSGAHEGFSSTWVGIDGATSGDQYLIQTGTEADVINGRRYYRAWWEVITPTDVAPETLFTTLAVHAGDSISASVARTSSGHWTMRLSNTTTGHSASHTASFAGPGSSVEWIQEDTDVNGSISTAPDWGSVAFTRLTLNGKNPKLATSEGVDIVDSHGTRETATATPSSSGAGFTTRWLAPGTPTKAG